MKSFGNFSGKTAFKEHKGYDGVRTIRADFGGSVAESIYTSNRESAWSRWRRGYEISCANPSDDALTYPFTYRIPVIGGVPENTLSPQVAGSFKGFFTMNKELGMHWAGATLAGSLRFDNLDDSQGTKCSIASVTEDDYYWYIKLAGNWSSSNTVPSPIYVDSIPGMEAIEPMNGNILEDRIITADTPPITQNDRDPSTGNLYGYVAALLVEVDGINGILKLKKQGSLEATQQGVLVTPATRPPTPGRFLMNGARFSCTCQDFSRRNYAYITTMLGQRKGKQFPYTKCATLKPGRYEKVKYAGQLLDAAMTKAQVNRDMTIISPEQEFTDLYALNEVIAGNARDFPGVFSDFGSVYLRNSSNDANAVSESMPNYKDYTSSDNEIVTLSDNWTYLLDEYRYCKHIYAMRFEAGIAPPEPSDFPVGIESMAEWEDKLMVKTAKEQEAAAYKLFRYGLAYMDVPPRNIQAPMMVDMTTKLFNMPSYFIRMEGFTMYDKNGTPYIPYLDEKPFAV